MTKINCMYCGEEIADDIETCPACGAPSHYRKRGGLKLNTRKFIIFFILLVTACVFFMLWLPR